MRNGFSLAAGLGYMGNAVFGLLIVLENTFVASFPTLPLIAKLILKESELAVIRQCATRGRIAIHYLTRFSKVMILTRKPIAGRRVLCFLTMDLFEFYPISSMWHQLVVSKNEWEVSISLSVERPLDVLVSIMQSVIIRRKGENEETGLLWYPEKTSPFL